MLISRAGVRRVLQKLTDAFGEPPVIHEDQVTYYIYGLLDPSLQLLQDTIKDSLALDGIENQENGSPINELAILIDLLALMSKWLPPQSIAVNLLAGEIDDYLREGIVKILQEYLPASLAEESGIIFKNTYSVVYQIIHQYRLNKFSSDGVNCAWKIASCVDADTESCKQVANEIVDEVAYLFNLCCAMKIQHYRAVQEFSQTKDPVKLAEIFMFAVQESMLDAVVCFFETGKITENLLNNKIAGLLPLFEACTRGDLQIAMELIQHGAQVELTADTGSFKNMTSLMVGSYQGYLKVVKLLLDKGANPTLTASCGSTALFVAAQNGHIEVVRILLLQKCIEEIIDHPNLAGITPLMIASHDGHLVVVKKLLEAGADLKKIANSGATALYLASQNGHADVVRILLSQECIEKIIDYPTMESITPLMIASQKGYLAVVEQLVKAGADLEKFSIKGATALSLAALHGHALIVDIFLSQKNITKIIDYSPVKGFTPLMLACEYGYLETAKKLVKAGADVTKIANDGTTALSRASSNGRDVVVGFLLSQKDIQKIIDYLWIDGVTPLMIASQNGHLEVVKQLVKAGADVTIIANSGATALFLAAQVGHDAVVEFLLSQKSIEKIIDHPISSGATSLIIASQNGHLAVVKQFLKFNADVKKISEPLFIASEHGHSDVVRIFLLQEGIEKIIDVPIIDGINLLMIASQNGHLEVVKQLAKAGADVTIIANSGATALFLAAQDGYDAVVELLLSQAGIQKIINHPMMDGSTPLMIASQEGHLAVVKLLLNAGANVTKSSNDRMTALDAAISEGHTQIVTLLREHEKKLKQQPQQPAQNNLNFSYPALSSNTEPSYALQQIQAFNKAGIEAFKAGNHQESKEQFMKVLPYWENALQKKVPGAVKNLATVLYNLGSSEMKLNHLHEAVALLTKAVDLFDESPEMAPLTAEKAKYQKRLEECQALIIEYDVEGTSRQFEGAKLS